MRLILTILLSSLPGMSAISLVSHTYAKAMGSADSITTPPVNCSGASLLILNLSQYLSGGGVLGISDSSSNHWTSLAPQNYGTVSQTTYYVANPKVSPSQTFTSTVVSGSPYQTILVACFSGAAASAPLDSSMAHNLYSGTMQPGVVTPAINGSIVISGIASIESATISIDSGFTITDEVPYVGNYHMGAGMAYLVQGAAGASNPAWTLPSAPAFECGTNVVFSPAAASNTAARRFLK